MHEGLKFTMNRSQGKSVNYLDLSLNVSDEKVLINWYRKPISSGRMLNYLSNHHPKVIRNVATQFFVRILNLSDKSYRRSVIDQGINLLRLNCYPRWYIEIVLTDAVKKIS